MGSVDRGDGPQGRVMRIHRSQESTHYVARAKRFMLLPVIVALWSAAVAQPGVTPEHRPTPPDSHEQRIADLVVASRILVQEGVLDSFGHVTVRSLNDPNHYFMPRAMPPALVTTKDIVELDLDSVPIDANAPRTNGERFIHREIYRIRPDVGAIVHSHSPAVIPFSTFRPTVPFDRCCTWPDFFPLAFPCLLRLVEISQIRRRLILLRGHQVAI